MATSPDDQDEFWMEREASKKVNALFANRIYVQPLPGSMVRLSFGEQIDAEDPQYHTALVLTAAEAAAFSDLIYRIASPLIPPPIIQTSVAEPSDGDK